VNVKLCPGLAALLFVATQALADEVKVGDLVVAHLWARATPTGARTGAGYLTVENHGQADDRLVGVTSPAAAKAELHLMSMDGGVMRMRPAQGGIAIAAGKSVTLAPNGYHIMLMGLNAPLKQGDKVAMTLMFEKAGKLDVELDVQAIGAPAPAGGQPSPMKM
jgi:copper(I)-binding protein